MEVGSTTSKLVFNSNGTVLEYDEDEITDTSNYSIAYNYDSESDSNFYFLKVVNIDGDVVCFEINGINENNSGILSLTSMKNGKVRLFVNDPAPARLYRYQ